MLMNTLLKWRKKLRYGTFGKKKKVKEKKIQYGMDSSNMPTNDKMKLGNGSRDYH